MYRGDKMSAITRAPQNTNLLQPTKFLLSFDRIRTTQYFCQSVNLPGVSLGEVNRATPFLDMFSPGTKLTYSPLNVEFLVDEELQSWKNIYDWFLSIADPDGFEKRDGSKELQTIKHFSDATLTILTGLNNPILRVQYTNLFPLSINDIQFNTTQSADTIITATATFRYQSYKYLTV
jgi:hypothetical protein